MWTWAMIRKTWKEWKHYQGLISKLICLGNAPVSLYDMNIWQCLAALGMKPTCRYVSCFHLKFRNRHEHLGLGHVREWSQHQFTTAFGFLNHEARWWDHFGGRPAFCQVSQCEMSLPTGSDDSSELSGCWRLVEGRVGLEDRNAMECHLLLSPQAWNGSQYVTIHVWSELVTNHPTHLGLPQVYDAFTLQKMKPINEHTYESKTATAWTTSGAQKGSEPPGGRSCESPWLSFPWQRLLSGDGWLLLASNAKSTWSNFRVLEWWESAGGDGKIESFHTFGPTN